MKKLIRLFGATGVFSLLAACSAPAPQPTAPLDMAAVEAYNQKVYSGNTVAAEQRNKPQVQSALPLNGSDSSHRNLSPRTSARPNLIIAPTVGYGYWRGHRHPYYGW
ncbi:hypothetical protein EDC45_0318 [Mesocricetibacter intestinalis]|uniref:Lipoprotein n=1 Tax=Mesocricetibacter intestinalis TaxID=1521930 RepID=A0A4R6VLH1_9PAST|nr:hypothetical protein [Mesocricetibacter intestinalis]TDQ59660.1 hypothetical protein EDC45_0318 [Mesocricetibacter intestinalis]